MSYNLNQAAEESRSGPRWSIYAQGVEAKKLKAFTETGVMVRILPAFGDRSNPSSYVPFRDTDGNFAPFARLVPVFQDIGHGEFKNRRKLVSAKAHDPAAYCALEELSDHIRMNQAWSYLHNSPGKDARGYDIPPSFPKKAKSILLMNVVDMNNQAEGCFLGEFSVSVFYAMNGQQGVLNMVNPGATQEMVNQNYLARWVAGDLTCPVNGPALRIAKDMQGKGYDVSFATNQHRQIYRLDVTNLLPGRRNLDNDGIEAIIPVVDEVHQVQTLMDCLRGVSPSGVHEWVLLREVFGARHNIPEPPQYGHGMAQPNPVHGQGGGLGMNPAQQPLAPLPQSTVPGGQLPVQQPVPAPAQPQMTAYVPPQAAIPAAPPQTVAAQAPYQPAQQPVQQQPAQAPVQQAPVQQVAAEQPQAEAARPAVPGQGVSGYDVGAFMERLKGGN